MYIFLNMFGYTNNSVRRVVSSLHIIIDDVGLSVAENIMFDSIILKDNFLYHNAC